MRRRGQRAGAPAVERASRSLYFPSGLVAAVLFMAGAATAELLRYASDAASAGPGSLRAVAMASLSVVPIALAVVTTIAFARSIILPLRALTHTVRRLGGGQFRLHWTLRRRDEIGLMARALAAASADIHGQITDLRESERTMQVAFAHMADGVVALDSSARVLFLNGIAEITFGRSVDQARGKTLLEVSLHEEIHRIVSESLTTREPRSGEVSIRRPLARVLRLTSTPVGPEEDSPLGALLVFQDVTEVRRLEQIRRDFVSNASHELKTPLATLGVLVESLCASADSDPDDKDRFLPMIGTEVNRMAALVEDLLELSRLESDARPTEYELIDVAGLARAMVDRYGPLAGRRGQSLSSSGTAGLTLADPRAMIHAIGNLVENALNYTPEGGQIEIRHGEVDGRVFIQVCDTGIGIPSWEQERIFERFYRVDRARSRSTGGTGLGLSIAKHCVETHAGRIEVESEPGHGSRFTVWLPASEDPLDEHAGSIADGATGAAVRDHAVDHAPETPASEHARVDL